MRPLFLCFWVVGVLVVVPVLSWCSLVLLAVAGVTAGSEWIFLGVWQVGNLLWMMLAYLLDARNAERAARRHPSAGSSPVILRWRNRLLVHGGRSRLRLLAWFCLGPGSRIFFLPVFTVMCSVAAWGFATIEERPTSPGPDPLLAAFFAGIAVVLAAMTVHRFWARARLLRHGRLVTGTVLDAGAEGSLWRIDYRFHNEAGEEQTSAEHLDFRPSRMPVAGDRLAIHYDETAGAQIL